MIIELEGEGCYELAPDSVPAELPPVGGVLTEAQHRAIALAAARKRVARRLFVLLDRRLRSVAALQRKLVAEGHPPEAVTQVLASMQEQGLHSDRQYAEAYCRDCLLSRAVGRGYLEAKLRGQGVSAAVARAASNAVLDAARESELAWQAARNRWRKLGAERGPRVLAKVVRHLQGRGFAAGLAVKAARDTQPAAYEE